MIPTVLRSLPQKRIAKTARSPDVSGKIRCVSAGEAKLLHHAGEARGRRRASGARGGREVPPSKRPRPVLEESFEQAERLRREQHRTAFAVELTRQRVEETFAEANPWRNDGYA